MTDPTIFLDSLLNFDKENIPESVITKIEPYIAMEAFTPEQVSTKCVDHLEITPFIYKSRIVNYTWHKASGLNSTTYTMLIGHVCSSGLRLGVDLRTCTRT